MNKPTPKMTAWTAFREKVGAQEALRTKRDAKKYEDMEGGSLWTPVRLLSDAEVEAMIKKEMGR